MIRFFRKYKGFAECAISAKLNYRGALLMNIVNSSVSLVASLFLWNVLFREQSVISGYTRDDMVVYLLVVFLMQATLGGETEWEIAGSVLDGSIIMDLIKPINFQTRCLFQTMGASAAEGTVAALVAGTAAVFLSSLSEYAEPKRCVLLLLSLVLAFLVKFCISYLAGLCCFFTNNGYGVIYMRQVITDIFSGALLPLSFYPEWFEKIAKVLPFQSIMYTPTQIFLGRIEGEQAVNMLLLQLVWVIVLWVFGYFFFRFAIRRVTIQGG